MASVTDTDPRWTRCGHREAKRDKGLCLSWWALHYFGRLAQRQSIGLTLLPKPTFQIRINPWSLCIGMMERKWPTAVYYLQRWKDNDCNGKRQRCKGSGFHEGFGLRRAVVLVLMWLKPLFVKKGRPPGVSFLLSWISLPTPALAAYNQPQESLVNIEVILPGGTCVHDRQNTRPLRNHQPARKR
jgi:hypothetical protein